MFKNKINSLITWLLVWSIAVRAIVWILLPPAKTLDQYQPTDILFFSALTDHFSDFFRFSTQIPPASYLINAFVFFLFGVKTALTVRAFLLLVFIMDISAVLLLFNAAKRLGSDKRKSFFYPHFIFNRADPF